jgi:hypothetical protein
MPVTPRRILLATASVACVSAVAVLLVPGAGAAGRCGGKLIFHQPIKDAAHRTVAELDVYWNAATKRNCAMTRHSGRTWGKKRYTRVTLYRCRKGIKRGEQCWSDRPREQAGRFAYYAGPVSVEAAHRCIVAFGAIDPGPRQGVVGASTPGGIDRAQFCH